MPLLVNGVSNTLLAEGKVKVFFSNSDNCKKTVKEGVLLVHNTFSTSSHNAFVAIPDDLADSSKTYVCVSFNSVTSAVTAGGAAVVVSGEGGTPARSVLTVLYGMKGKIDLADYIRGTQSGRDSILETLNDEETSHFIQFVPFSFSVSSNEDDKSEACLRSEEEATLPTDGSILVIKYPLKISRNTGILCLGKKYINIDYEVVSGTDFIHSVDGVTEFSKLPFILSNAPARDVSTIELGANNYGDIGVFYAPDGSDCGDDQALVPLLSHDRSYYAYLPEKEGTYLICAGLTGKRTNVFVSTESVIVVESFERAAEQWKTSIGVGSGEWRTCGSSSLCGSNLQQNYVQVCSPISTNVMQPWPIRLQDVFNYMGSFNVRISFSDVPIPTGLYLNAFFIPVEYGAAHCRLYDKLKMSSDELFSSSAVATLGQTIVYFQDSFDLGSMVIGLTPLDKPCAAKNIVFKSYVNPNGRNSLSSFDASPLVLKMEEKFYALCYLTDSKWTRAGFTIVQTASSPAVPPSRIEAIGAVTSVSEESAIYLWRTQTFAEWNVVGIFYPEESIELALVWDDPTCAAKAAYTTAVRYVSLTGGKLSVDVTAVSEAPKASSVLYSCYRIGDSVLKPLRIDRLKSLTVILQPLSVSSLNYLPRISASYNTKENITVQITDIDNPPVQQVALFKESEKDSSDKSCSTDSSKYVTTLPVTKDSFGHRSFTVPSDVVNRVGVKDTTVYLRLCASAAAEGVLAPVSAYIVLNGWEVDLSVSPVALVFYFTPLNGTTNIAESDGVSSALLSYAKSVGVSNTDDILVTMKATNRYLFYLEPSKDLNSAKSLEETGKLYKALSEGTNLPLYANNQDNNVFVATSVEGVYARGPNSAPFLPVHFS
ncbi:hypothetical protein AGDE_10372 [Angomonas deanei]|nr:hypothetical protein AGDE_10372 [Angomonas deanei]|eukprot:EPY28457.1 hypothetical protein AGDE_10372 [Angomonas deanei]